MKVVKYISLITAFLLLVNIFSCEERNNDPDCHAPRDFLDYWFFPEGSWWVYTINDTIFDSLTNRNHIANDNHNSYPCNKKYASFFSHHTSDSIKDYIGEHNFFTFNFNGDYWPLRSESYQNNYWGFGYFFKNGAELGDVMYWDINQEDSLKVIVQDTNQLNIKAGIFYQTFHIKFNWYNYSELPGFFITDIWLSKNVGVVKLKFLDSTNIELVRYHINK